MASLYSQFYGLLVFPFLMGPHRHVISIVKIETKHAPSAIKSAWDTFCNRLPQYLGGVVHLHRPDHPEKFTNSQYIVLYFALSCGKSTTFNAILTSTSNGPISWKSSHMFQTQQPNLKHGKHNHFSCLAPKNSTYQLLWLYAGQGCHD
ncbi:hypothetical protein VNO77_26672 [Canavalia gladiata]|uniref:Uncharacterized protein n=1 Tax=Canavalia gladiata TaxID=3824 RepID=A0AAN9Q9V1_CANGL